MKKHSKKVPSVRSRKTKNRKTGDKKQKAMKRPVEKDSTGLYSSFVNVLSMIRKKPKLFFFIFIIDILYVSFVLHTNRSIGSIQSSLKTSSHPLLYPLVLMIIFFLAGVLVYSIAKYAVMLFTEKFFIEKRFSFDGFKSFYALNLRMYLILMLWSIIIMLILKPLFPANSALLSTFMKVYIYGIITIAFILGYFFIYACHSVYFTCGKEKVIRSAIKNLFSGNIVRMLYVILYSGFILASLSLIYGLFGMGLGVIFTDAQLKSGYGIYERAFMLLFKIAAFLILSMNRIHFLAMFRKIY